jgi:hypothetical protein
VISYEVTEVDTFSRSVMTTLWDTYEEAEYYTRRMGGSIALVTHGKDEEYFSAYWGSHWVGDANTAEEAQELLNQYEEQQSWKFLIHKVAKE